MATETNETINLTDTYKTRHGLKVRIYAVDCGGNFPVHGAILFNEGTAYEEWNSDSWTAYGKYDLSVSKSPNDLVRISPYAETL